MTIEGEITLAYRANGGTFDVHYIAQNVDGECDDRDPIEWEAFDSETGHPMVDEDFIDYYGDWILQQIKEELNGM